MRETNYFERNAGRMRFFQGETDLTSLSEGSELGLNKMNFEEFERMVSTAGFTVEARASSETLGKMFPLLLRAPQLKFFAAGTVHYLLCRDVFS